MSIVFKMMFEPEIVWNVVLGIVFLWTMISDAE